MTKSEFQDLFNRLYSPLCNYANTILKDYDQSEDIVQDVLFNFWNKRDTLEIEDNKIENYLIRATKFKCIDNHRQAIVKRKYESETIHSQDLFDIQSSSEAPDYKSIIFEAISQLPEKTRIVFVLSKMDGLSYNEIAEKLNISPKTVDNQMGRAFKHLRKIINSEHLFTLLLFFLIHGRG